MDYLEMQKDIGSKILIPIGKGSLQLQVIVHNVRLSYGRKQWLVGPSGAGYGEAWIDAAGAVNSKEGGAA
jgi:hypothetical protein